MERNLWKINNKETFVHNNQEDHKNIHNALNIWFETPHKKGWSCGFIPKHKAGKYISIYE